MMTDGGFGLSGNTDICLPSEPSYSDSSVYGSVIRIAANKMETGVR
jgi:hypothetical protein